MLKACIDSNVYVSAIAFKGKPLDILDLALEKQYSLITSSFILNEVKSNLISKIGLPETFVQKFLDDIIRVANIYEPTGSIQYISHKKDSLVLETAIIGNAEILVTGDKKDLLPLKQFNGICIESPSTFLRRFNNI